MEAPSMIFDGSHVTCHGRSGPDHEFEGAVILAMFRDPLFRVAFDALDVRVILRRGPYAA